MEAERDSNAYIYVEGTRLFVCDDKNAWHLKSIIEMSAPKRKQKRITLDSVYYISKTRSFSSL